MQREISFASAAWWHLSHPREAKKLRHEARVRTAKALAGVVASISSEIPILTSVSDAEEVHAATVSAVLKAHAHSHWLRTLLSWALLRPGMLLLYFVTYLIFVNASLCDARNLDRAAALVSPYAWWLKHERAVQHPEWDPKNAFWFASKSGPLTKPFSRRLRVNEPPRYLPRGGIDASSAGFSDGTPQQSILLGLPNGMRLP